MDNLDPNKQIIIDRFNTLPKVVQDAITDSGWEQKIRIIAQKNNLAIGDANTLETNTFLVMLGFLNPKEYANTLKREIPGLDDTRLNNIVASVENDVFQNIRKILVELSEKADANSQDENPEFEVPENLPTGDAVAGNTPIISSGEKITRQSVAKEMEEHIEILPENGTDNTEGSLPMVPVIKDDTGESNTFIENKLKTATETPKETISYNPQEIDPYREMLK